MHFALQTYTDLLDLPGWTMTLLTQGNILPAFFLIASVVRTLIIVDESTLIVLSVVVIVCVVVLVVVMRSLEINNIWIDILVSLHYKFLTFNATLLQNARWTLVARVVIVFRLLYAIF